jgi:hypothetical protein
MATTRSQQLETGLLALFYKKLMRPTGQPEIIALAVNRKAACARLQPRSRPAAADFLSNGPVRIRTPHFPPIEPA